jgi:hypothetical protein
MTKVIFESETLIGKCDYDAIENNGFRYAEPDYAEIWVHTVGAVNKGLFKIEQHCYVRHGEDAPVQPWVRPEMFLEPATISRPEMTDLAKTLHHEFVSRAKEKLQDAVVLN